ncbi:MAG: NAD-dependent epimerase/dehydratase family protein [Myxococcota bacterium]|nr:NAD-dependent epimerase/dehydratase family protein [Myxococcota bacterium]
MKRQQTNQRAAAFDGTIAVSGAAGRLGSLVVRRLHRTDAVITIDDRDFAHRPADVGHYQTELRRKDCKDLFRRHTLQAVIHLGPFHTKGQKQRPSASFTAAVENFARLLEYCDHYHIRKLVLLSSADVYGARARNPQFLTEEAPLLAKGFASLRDVDMMAQSFFWKRPDIETVILRPAHITGGIANLISRYFRMSPVPVLMGYDPMIQLVHEEDVIESIRLALSPGQRGIFNIAGPPPLPLSRILRRLGRAVLPLPHIMARPLLSQLNRLGRVDFEPAYTDYIRYVCMVDDARARNILGYRPQYNFEDTIQAVDIWQ